MDAALERTNWSRDCGSELLSHLRSLDVLLKIAVNRARVLYGVDDERGALRGVYIDEEEIDRLVERDEETLGSRSLDVLREFRRSARIVELSDRWGFSEFDTATLLLALAPEVDLRYERIYGYLQDDVTKRKPTVDLALNLLCENQRMRIEQRSRFAPDAPLLRSGLLRLLPDPSHNEAPLLAHYLRLDERAIRALVGDDRLDHRLLPFCERTSCPPSQSAFGSENDMLQRLPAFAAIARSAGRPARLLFSGPATATKGRAVESLAAASGATLLTAEMDRCARWRTEPIEIASLLKREAHLSNSVLFVTGLAPGSSDESSARSFVETLVEYPGIIVISSDSPLVASVAGSDQFLNIPFVLPAFEARQEMWQQLTSAAGIVASPVALAILANNFRLTPEQIASAVSTTRQRLEWRLTGAESLSETEIQTELLAAARGQTGLELAALTSKLKLVYGWQDIVLTEDTLELLKEVCQRVTHRHDVLERGGFGKKLSSGKGITVLFAGPSGTGKTMAAEIIAHELALDLFRIDLSSVVSKYIGETEKNLERIFNAATHSNSVLLFDEADALFGKRSAVSDAHDRYANVEISYLLQKMEQYEGISILTSNLRTNIDEGFWRRLAFTVHFPFPDEQTRIEIWKKIWPPETELDADVDFVQLAHRFKLSGGNIRNIGLAAAFLAAAESRPVRMADILHATRREYAKVGKNLTLDELDDVVR